MKKCKNNLDEMQEQKILHIERNGFWFALWGLLAMILIQIVIGKEDVLRNITGEWIIFLCLSVYMVYSCIKNGIWDRRFSPNPKTNILGSLIVSLFVGGFYFVISYSKYQKLSGAIATGMVGFIISFTLSFFALSVCASLYKKRYRKLETDTEKQSEKPNGEQ